MLENFEKNINYGIIKLMQEIWKPIKGYEGLYEVSNFGRIKNRHNKILKPRVYDRRYLYVILYKKGKYKNYRVHRIVAQTFIPNLLIFLKLII